MMHYEGMAAASVSSGWSKGVDNSKGPEQRMVCGERRLTGISRD